MCFDASIKEINTTLLGNRDLKAWEEMPLGEREEEEALMQLKALSDRLNLPPPERALIAPFNKTRLSSHRMCITTFIKG